MPNEIAVNLIVEDLLSEEVLRKLLTDSNRSFVVGACYGHMGQGFIRKKLSGFNFAARGMPYFVLTDLDTSECPPKLLNELFGSSSRHPNLLIRIAVREVESWLLADRNSFAQFVGTSNSKIPHDVEALIDPKTTLIQIVDRSPKRSLRTDVVPVANSTRKQGPAYNQALARFVRDMWSPIRASENSVSLASAIDAISSFVPRGSNL